MQVKANYENTPQTIDSVISTLTGIDEKELNKKNVTLTTYNHQVDIKIGDEELSFSVIPIKLFHFLIENLRCPLCGSRMEIWKQKGEYLCFSCSNFAVIGDNRDDKDDCSYSDEGDKCCINLDNGELDIDYKQVSYDEYNNSIDKLIIKET